MKKEKYLFNQENPLSLMAIMSELENKKLSASRSIYWQQSQGMLLSSTNRKPVTSKQVKKEEFDKSEWLTSKEVVKILDISTRTWRNYRDQRRIPFSQTSARKIYVKRSDLEAYLESGRINAR